MGGAILKRELRDLKERYGVSAADLTADELEALVLACRRVANPFSEANAALCGMPVRVCDGVVMWPITAGAQIWLDEYAETWWGRGHGFMMRWARVFALVHAREADAFASLTTKNAARAAILKTCLRLACHGPELLWAMERCYGVKEEDPGAPPPKVAKRQSEDANAATTDFAALVARLEVESGIPAETWLWGRSLSSMLRAYMELHSFALTFSMCGGGASAKGRMLDELDEAMNALARVKKAIWERLKLAEREHGSTGGAHV